MSDGRSGLILDEPLLIERSTTGRCGFIPEAPADLPDELAGHLRSDGLTGMPELTEQDVVRHFTRLSQWNFGVDSGLYPLGSCTMKYNPKINEAMARTPGFADLHPYAGDELSQGALELAWLLERHLVEITGLHAASLQPSAGAQGEMTGLMMIRACHEAAGRPRRKVLIPDSAHGTNPASSALNRFEVVEVASGPDGVLTPESVAERMDDETAALLMTNPNTLGLFERNVREIADIVHARGGLMYCDGANMNALLGAARPGDMGFDVIQLNLHKTFSTPHGGGGPGSGPVCFTARLEPFRPVPVIVRAGDGSFRLEFDRPASIGRVRSFLGNYLVALRAYCYIREMGAEGLKAVSETAVLNANYLKVRLASWYHLAYDALCMHECVLSDKLQQRHGVTTMDIAKALIDRGIHPPTIYFPLIVKGAMMVEPTETENLETLDRFVETMAEIAELAAADPGALHRAPERTIIGRVDDVAAARRPKLTWFDSEDE